MELARITLAATTLLCSLVTGVVWTFAIVVMPGIRRLKDHDFLQAFKVMDRIIQDSQPLFVLVWLGSILSILASVGLGLWRMEGLDQLLILTAAVLFLFGVQLPTFKINVPLNDQLQRADLDAMSEPELAAVRQAFEPRWVRWNAIRTVIAMITTALLILVLLRL